MRDELFAFCGLGVTGCYGSGYGSWSSMQFLEAGRQTRGQKKLTSVTTSVNRGDFEFQSVTRSVFVTLRSVTLKSKRDVADSRTGFADDFIRSKLVKIGQNGPSAPAASTRYGRKKIMVPLGPVGSRWVPLGAERSR